MFKCLGISFVEKSLLVRSVRKGMKEGFCAQRKCSALIWKGLRDLPNFRRFTAGDF